MCAAPVIVVQERERHLLMREKERWVEPEKMDQQWKHRERWVKVGG